MSDEIRVISAANFPTNVRPQYSQSGNDAVMIPNTALSICRLPSRQLRCRILVETSISLRRWIEVDREYYNIFVLAGEKFNRPYFMVPRDRVLNQCMTQETMDKFAPINDVISF